MPHATRQFWLARFAVWHAGHLCAHRQPAAPAPFAEASRPARVLLSLRVPWSCAGGATAGHTRSAGPPVVRYSVAWTRSRGGPALLEVPGEARSHRRYRANAQGFALSGAGGSRLRYAA